MRTEEEETSPGNSRSASADGGRQHFGRKKRERAHEKIRGIPHFCYVKGGGGSFTSEFGHKLSPSRAVTQVGDPRVCLGLVKASGAIEKEKPAIPTSDSRRTAAIEKGHKESWSPRWSKVQWRRNTFPAPHTCKGCFVWNVRAHQMGDEEQF